MMNVLLYFLNYMNDLHSHRKTRSESFEFHHQITHTCANDRRVLAPPSSHFASVVSKMATMQNKIFCVREFCKTESATVVQRTYLQLEKVFVVGITNFSKLDVSAKTKPPGRLCVAQENVDNRVHHFE